MIIPFSEVTPGMVAVAIERDIDSLRHTVKGEDRVILKYEGEMPEVFADYDKYSNDEMYIIVTDVNGDWYSPMDA